MDKLEQLRLFLLRDKALQPTTVQFNLKLMRRILKDVDPLILTNFSKFITDLIDKRRDASYINQYIVVLHYWGEFFAIPEFTAYPFYKGRDRDDFIRAIMADEEVEAFVSIPNPYPKGGLYWRRFEMWTVFWLINAYHGFRMGETVKMRKRDADFGRNVFIVSGKTGNRIVPMSFVVRDKVRNYIDNVMVGDYLFPPIHNTGFPYMRDMSWQEDFKKRVKKLAPVHPSMASRENLQPYSLRHSFGTRQADEDVSIFKIQKAMGHRRLDTTAKYIHMSLKSVQEMIDNDRLALPHKRGVDIIQTFLDYFYKAEKRYRQKVYINIQKRSKDGRKVRIDIEAIDDDKPPAKI